MPSFDCNRRTNIMPKPITVRDRAGNIVERLDGVALDGDQVQTRMMFTDGDSAARRHAFVREKLGPAADGKSAAFLDGAYAQLTGTAVPPPPPPTGPLAGLTDAQRAVGRDGVQRALAHHAARQTAGGTNDAAANARDAMGARLNDGWKNPQEPVTLSDRNQAELREAGLATDARAVAHMEMQQRLSEGYRS